MAEFDPQAYLNSQSNSPTAEATAEFDPVAYLAESVKVENNTDIDNMLDRQNNPKAPVKNKRGETTALEDYENYKPTVEDIKNSETTFDSQLEDYYFDNNVYNQKKKSKFNNFGGAIIKGPRPQKPIGANQKQLSDYKLKLNDWETYQDDTENSIKETKLKRDTNPILDYLKEAKKTLGNNATKETVTKLAKENYIKAQESKIIQERVYAQVEDFVKEDNYSLRKGDEQKANVGKIKTEIGDITTHQEKNNICSS